MTKSQSPKAPSPFPSPRWGEGGGEGLDFGLPARSRFGEGRCLRFGACSEGVEDGLDRMVEKDGIV